MNFWIACPENDEGVKWKEKGGDKDFETPEKVRCYAHLFSVIIAGLPISQRRMPITGFLMM